MAKILIIDDEESLRDNMTAFLEDEGHRVLATHCAEAGLQKLAQFQPDLVIVDLRLEGASGERFVKTAYSLQPTTCYIIHTGSKEYTLPRSLEMLGISDRNLLYKPIPDLLQLSNLINELLAEHTETLKRHQS
ncbi:response regulator [Aurantivibrio plasticivorans]